MYKTLLVPGLDASPAPHWQHWWAAHDPRALMIDLPNPAAPDPAAWEAELAGAILHHPDAVLVGHSLGAVLIARVLTRWPQLRVTAAMLVAPAEPSRDPRIAGFGPIPERSLGRPTLVVGSRNDPWMSCGQARALAAVWGAKHHDLGFAGHVNVASGFGPWPRGLDLRDGLLAETLAGARQTAPALRPQAAALRGGRAAARVAESAARSAAAWARPAETGAEGRSGARAATVGAMRGGATARVGRWASGLVSGLGTSLSAGLGASFGAGLGASFAPGLASDQFAGRLGGAPQFAPQSQPAE